MKNANSTYALTWQKTGIKDTFTVAGSSWAILTSEVDRNGNTLTMAYDASGSYVTAITGTQGRVTTPTYITSGNVQLISSMRDPSGRVFGYGYDSYNNLTSYTDPAGKVTTYAYDPNFNLTQITDPLGHQSKMVYDTSRRLTSITYVTNTQTGTGSTYTLTYNAGNTVVTDPNGHATTSYYDAYGRVIKVTDALGNSVQTTWTADNHVQSATDAKGQVTTFGYDGNNNLTSVQVPTGARSSLAYADSTHPYYPTSSTDAQGNTTSVTYDANGNVTTITNQLPSQNQTQLFYNSNGTLNHVIDARGNTTSYGYDAGNKNLTSITPPAPLGATTIGRDALSRTSSVTDGKGQQRTYTYDALDRVTALTYPAYTTGNVSTVLDADGNTTSMTDSTGTTSYTYDALNRQTRKTLPGNGYFAYAYDVASNLTALTDAATVPASPLTISYGYNALNLVTSLTEPNNVVTSFGYDANHQRTSTTYPDGVVMNQTYDNSQRLSSIFSKNPANTTLTSFVYNYTNPATNTDTMLPYKITEQDSLRNVTVTQGYDKLNRMTSWVVQKSDLTYLHSYFYQFDGVGNRTQIIADPVNSTNQIVGTPSNGQANSNESDLTFNAPSEISQIVAYGPTGSTDPTHPAITTLFTYDAEGNQTGNNGGNGPSPKPATLTYLPTNQTQSISNTNQDAVTMTWTGPGQGQRTKRTWTDHTTSTSYSASFTYSLLGMSGRVDTSKTPTTSYFVRDPYGTLVSQRNTDGTENYYLFDGQGTVVAMEDPGSITGSYDICPTGNEADGDATLTTVAKNNPFRQYSYPYDGDTRDIYAADGSINAVDNGIGTQQPRVRAGTGIVCTQLPAFDFGTLSAATVNFGLGTRKIVAGVEGIVAAGVIEAALPFPVNLVAAPVVGTAAVGVGYYQVVTGEARIARSVRQVVQVTTQPVTDRSIEGNVARFVSGIGPFGLPNQPTVTNVLENLP